MAVQSLKPRIDLIKARYGEDKDKISMETSALYKQAGVNPLAGGCCCCCCCCALKPGLRPASCNPSRARAADAAAAASSAHSCKHV